MQLKLYYLYLLADYSILNLGLGLIFDFIL